MAALFSSNMHHIVFRLGLRPRHKMVSLQRSARSPNCFGEGIQPPRKRWKGREGEGKEVREKEEKKGGRRRKGKGKGGAGRGGSGGRVLIETFPSPWQWGTKYMYDKIRTPFESSFIRDTYILTFLSSNTFCLRYWICKDASYMHLWQNSSVVSPGTLWRRRPCIPLILFYPTLLI